MESWKRGHAALVGLLLIILVATAYSQEADTESPPLPYFDHENNIVLGKTKHNFVGCSRGSEVPRVLYDSQGRLITKRASSGALALRECLFIEEGDLVYLVRPGENVQIGEMAVAGYYINVLGEIQSFGPVWYPFRFLDIVRVEPKEPPVVDYEPAAVSDLAGPLPVGRWSVWTDFRPEWFAESNRGKFSYYEADWELRTDGRGNILEFHGKEGQPKHGFSFPAASGYLWTHGEEFAWEWREPEAEYTGHLVFLTTREDIYAVVRTTDDLLILLPSHVTGNGNVWLTDSESQRKNGWRARTLMVRIGSALDGALLRFRACVKGNKDRKLYELEECVDPFLDANGQRIHGVGINPSRRILE